MTTTQDRVTPEQGLATLKECLGGVVQGFLDVGASEWTTRFPNDAELVGHAALFHHGQGIETHADHEAAHRASPAVVPHHHTEAPR